MPSNNVSIEEKEQKEERVKLALEKIQNGATVKGVAKEYGLPVSTLRSRRKGILSRQEFSALCHRLSYVEEEFIIDWILLEEATGRPASHADIRGMANAILREQGSTTPIGVNWASRFFQRHANRISMKSGTVIEIERVEAITVDNLAPWFHRLGELLNEYHINPRNLYNMDETGTQEGDAIRRKGAGNASIKGVNIKKSSNTDWASVIECISATGRRLIPTVVFKGGIVQSSWAPSEGLPAWNYQATITGWTNTEIAQDWVSNSFIPETTPRYPHEWRFLILDGFSTHVDHFFQLTCLKNKVMLFYLPAHSSHKLQPLDVAVFSPLKTAYRKIIHASPLSTVSSPASKQRFVSAYYEASRKAMTTSNIQSGFKSAGIWPLNGDMVLEKVRQEAPPIRPSTPPPTATTAAPNAEKTLPFTPQKGVDLNAQFEWANSAGLCSRERRRRGRAFLSRVSKRIDADNATKASLRNKLDTAAAQLAAQSIKRGKKVKIDPNVGFARVEEFEVARAEKEAADKKESERATVAQADFALDSRAAYKEIKHIPFEDLCTTWALKKN
jgi:4-hydroxybenzoate polyprenyltransferase